MAYVAPLGWLVSSAKPIAYTVVLLWYNYPTGDTMTTTSLIDAPALDKAAHPAVAPTPQEAMRQLFGAWLDAARVGQDLLTERRRRVPRTGLQLLIVEDDPANLLVLRTYLKDRGFTVHAASGTSRALSVADAQKIDLVISDIMLLDGNGCDLMRQLKERHHVKGIAMSVCGSKADIQRSRDAGFAEHLIKPLDFRTLTDVIQRVAC